MRVFEVLDGWLDNRSHLKTLGKLRILHNCCDITEAKRLMLKMISGLIYNENNGSMNMMYLWYVLQFFEAQMDFNKQS